MIYMMMQNLTGLQPNVLSLREAIKTMSQK